MKTDNFHIDVYDWDVHLIWLADDDEESYVERVLNNLDIKKEDIKEVVSAFSKGMRDGGEHWTNKDKRESVILIYPIENNFKDVLFGVVCHEKRHLEDRILEHCRVKDIEAAGYLAGFLGEKMYNFFL